MKNRSLKYYIVYSSLAVIVIMVLLQPFGVDRIEYNKYPIIIGYGLLTAVALLISEVVTSYIFRLKRGKKSLKRSIIFNIIVSLVMGALISCYSSVVFTGSLKSAFYDMNGNFVLKAFWINTSYAIIISFFLFVYFYFVERSRFLSDCLKEEIGLNKALERKNAMFVNSNYKVKDTTNAEKKIELRGSTKESVELSPSSLQFIESEGNYVNIFFIENGVSQKKTLRCTLKQIEDSLCKYPNIIRCHRAFIVNIAKVNHVDGNAQGYRLHIENTDRTVLVSRAYASSVYDIIDA